jgi:hypothetical protein
MLDAHAAEPPCPNVVSEREAVRIARELAHSQTAEYGGVGIRAEWVDAVWSVLFTQIGGRYWLFVDVRADGLVAGCMMDVQCEPDPGLDVPACGAMAGEFIDEREAARIAADYVERGKIAPLPMQVDSALWYGAHWLIWVTPRTPAPEDSHFMVFVSPDGSETELVSFAEITPARESFLFREPVPR